MLFNNKKLGKIKNGTMTRYDDLLKRKKLLENKMANVQREKDLKIDKINNDYEAQLEELLRDLKLISNEISRSKEYVKEN